MMPTGVWPNRLRVAEWIESVMRNKSTALACCAAIAFAGIGYAQVPESGALAGHSDGEHSGGIWKAAVPRQKMQAEFDSFDPLGIAAGAKIQADCSLNWISPDDGKRYCFASGTSLVYFLDRPQANIQRARAGWLKIVNTSP
jgi:hypothetical protein